MTETTNYDLFWLMSLFRQKNTGPALQIDDNWAAIDKAGYRPIFKKAIDLGYLQSQEANLVTEVPVYAITPKGWSFVTNYQKRMKHTLKILQY